MTLPQIGQIYQVNKNEDTSNGLCCAWVAGEIYTGLVIGLDEQDIADMVSMKEYGPAYALFVKFLVGEKTIWLPYNENNFTRIL